VAVVLLSLACLGAGAWQVRRGLASVERLRDRLSAVHRGEAGRVDGAYPAEVQPLVDDLNALLEQRAAQVARAQARAGDLAHGLKTPLALLAQDVARLGAAGRPELAASLDEHVARMRRQIDYHLAHARAAASGASRVGARASVFEAAAALAQVLERIHADRRVTIEIRTDAAHTVACEREDLDEMLGNLMDNACKWARARAIVSSRRDGDSVEIVVDDDGGGLPAGMETQAMGRGVRLDEAVPGTGFGLAIVRDLAEIYGGALRLDRSAEGGVSAQLRLPAAGA
jgi:signal transduction histidine kinase